MANELSASIDNVALQEEVVDQVVSTSITDHITTNLRWMNLNEEKNNSEQAEAVQGD